MKVTNVFLIADTHFGHVGMTKFTRHDGTKLRPWDKVEDMDRDMIERWNAAVPKEGAKVYVLGDVAINRKALPLLFKLHGDKVLIKGNHDIFKLQDYVTHFRDIRACWPLGGMLLSHIPVHPESLSERWSANVHGHLHYRRVLRPGWKGDASPKEIDPRYFCVSAEHTDYRPIRLTEVQRLVEEQQK